MENAPTNASQTVLHPLRYFPSCRDKVAKAWVRKRVRKYPRGEPWLNAEKLDASFGVRPLSPEPRELRKIELARSYRRIQSSRMFRTMSRGAVSLTELFPKSNNSGSNQQQQQQQQDGKFILVDRKQLQSLAQLEEQLRGEEQFLGDQCTWMLSEKQESARMPLPYIRIAVRCICEKEMHRYRQAIAELQAAWLEHIKEQRYARPPDMSLKVTHPMQSNAARALALKRFTDKVKLQRELQYMQHEDLLSSLTDRYVDAEERMVDYEQYFILATRYGPASEQDWVKDHRPGRRYMNRVNRAARLFQRVWGCYWAKQHLRRLRAARTIQTRFRGYRCRARWGTLIRLRRKYGPRSYLRQSWKAWQIFVLKIRRVKRMLCFNLDKFERAIFISWKDWTAAQRTRRTKQLQWFVGGERSRRLLRIVQAWRRYTDRCIWVKNIYKRAVQKPQFQRWKENVLEIKRYKAAQFIVVKCQHWWHMRQTRMRFHRMQAALKQIGRLVACRVDMIRFRKARRARRDALYEQYKIQAVEVETLAGMENERKRMLKLQEVMRNYERQMMKELNSHFERVHGRNQLQIQAKQIADVLNTMHPSFLLTRALHRQSNSFVNAAISSRDQLFWTIPIDPLSAEGVNTRKLPEFVRKQLLERGKNLFRSIARHDYLAKAAPRFSCAYPGCDSVFLTAEQYSEHIMNNCAASGYNLGDFSAFHTLLRDPYGRKMVRVFAVSTGMNNAANTLEFYLGIQDWRKDAFDTPQYEAHAIALFDSYISDTANFRTDCVAPSIREKLVPTIERVRLKEYEGFYQLFSVKGASVTIENLKAHGSSLLANRAQGFEFWCPDHVIDPHLFDEVEWAAFADIYKKLAADFFRSKYAQQYHTHSELLVGIRAERTREEWERRAHAERVRDAAKFKRQQAEIQEVCRKTTQIVMNNVFCEYYLEELIEKEVARRIAERSYAEQAAYEPIGMVADEVAWLVEEQCIDRLVSASLRNKDLWPDMEECWRTLQLANYDVAKLVRLQAWFRGVLSRKATRKHLSNRIIKMYDPNTGLYYYYDTELQTSVWEKPKLMQRLFAFSTVSRF